MRDITRMALIDTALNVIGLALISVFVILAYRTWLTTPIVVISHSTGECVEVISPDDADTCYNLPKRYTTEWSQ